MNATSQASTVTRRDFFATSSKLAAGAAAITTLPVTPFAHAASPGDTIRVALVGCGGRGTGAADHAMMTGEGVKLVAMGDVHKDRLDRSLATLAGKHKDKVDVKTARQFLGFESYKEAIASADVVILATPPGFRPMMFEEAVRQGKHVFMEKPVAVDGPGVRRVLAAAEEANKKKLKVAVGLQRHHQPDYNECLKRIHDGQLGDIVSMRCYWNTGPVGPKMTRAACEKLLGRAPTEMEYQLRNWYNFTWLCGDHIVEQHIHNLDVINWVKNAYPVSASGMGGRAWLKEPDHGEIFDHHAVEYAYADGSRLYSQCRQIPKCKGEVYEAVQGTKGSWTAERGQFVIRDLKQDITWRYKAGEGVRNDGHRLEHIPFFDAVRHDKPYNEAFNGAKSSLTAIMGRMATYGGQPVLWDDALNSKLDLAPERLAWDARPKVQPGPDGRYPFAIPGQSAAL
ncbi:MAG: Gfo/Idh/MocA family oxidoreductase [Verrucomicrobia bacterium]|nr:Gfo/Idh/MocA family oxidoreductase [Verrucomicrobiota bacterium]